jgi:hypothetical protein
LPGVYIPPHHPKPAQDQNIQIGIWWPAADSAKLRAAAQAWLEMARALDRVRDASRPAVLSLLADNQGPAMDAFAAYWQNWSGGNGYLAECSQACTAMAAALESYAGAVDDARRRVEDLVAEMATAVLIGVVLTPFTASLSLEVAGAVSGGLIAAAAAIGVELSATAIGIASTIVAGVSVYAVEAMAIDVAVIQPEKILVFQDQKTFSWDEVWQWGEAGAAGWVLGAGAVVGFRTLRTGFSAVFDDGAGVAGDGAAAARTPGPLTWGWPPTMPEIPKPGLGEPGAAEWRYQRYVVTLYEQGASASDILSFNAWKIRNFDPALAGGRPGRPGGPAQVATRRALIAEGYQNVENVQLGKDKFVDMVAQNKQGGTDYVEVDRMLKKGMPPLKMRNKLAVEIAALGPNDRLFYVDKNDLTNRILYLPGDNVNTMTVESVSVGGPQ